MNFNNFFCEKRSVNFSPWCNQFMTFCIFFGTFISEFSHCVWWGDRLFFTWKWLGNVEILLWHLAIIEWWFYVTFKLKKKTTLFSTRTNDKLVITEVVNDTITIKQVLDCTLKGLSILHFHWLIHYSVHYLPYLCHDDFWNYVIKSKLSFLSDNKQIQMAK